MADGPGPLGVKRLVHVGHPGARPIDGQNQEVHRGHLHHRHRLEGPQLEQGMEDAGQAQDPRGQEHLNDALPLHLGEHPQGFRIEGHLPPRAGRRRT